jgi:hypothetical protein
MRFLITVNNIVEIDDDTMLEYVQWCKEMKKEYNATEFYNWLGVNYYVGDFVVDEDEKVELTTPYLIDEINQTIEDNK